MNFWLDLKYAARLLMKSPGYSLLCICVVALSMGLGIFVYSAASSMAFEPLGFPGAERWYTLHAANSANATPWFGNVDAYTYQQLMERSRSVDHLGAISVQSGVLSEGEASTRLRAAAISPALLAATRVSPHLGRLFVEDEAQPGVAPAIILGFETWQDYFAGDPAIVGKQARVNAQPMQIVGVMPKDFYLFGDFHLWLPLQLRTLAAPSDSGLTVAPIFALHENQSLSAASSELQAIADAQTRAFPERFNPGRHFVVVPAAQWASHHLLPVMWMLVLMAAAVLLLGATNISMVFYARLLERSRELALRTALGASRGRLMRQTLLESACIVLLGLLSGLVLAMLSQEYFRGRIAMEQQILAQGRPQFELALQYGDVVVAILAALVLWLLSTLIPTLRIAKQDAAVVLAGSGKGTGARGRAKAAGTLVGLQVVIASLALVVCGTMVMAALNELGNPSGMDTAHIMLPTERVVFDSRYAEAVDRLRYWDELTASIKARAAGAEVAFATSVPTMSTRVPLSIETRQADTNRDIPALPLTAVSTNYFQLLGIALRTGRLFDATDQDASLDVAIVDENLASRYWPNESPLGKRIQLDPAVLGPWLTVVGVVSSVAGRPFSDDVGAVYRPLRQAVPAAFSVIVKLPPSALSSRTALKAAAFDVDRDLPLTNLQTLDAYLGVTNSATQSLIPVFTTVALITAILAATGLFGLISRSVAQRTQEVGVRRALGATRWQVTAVFLREGALYLGVAAFGGCLGIALTDLLSETVTTAWDHVIPVTAGVFVLMTLVIFVASYLPTRRATALEPGDALHYE